jgi:hypothetical protein
MFQQQLRNFEHGFDFCSNEIKQNQKEYWIEINQNYNIYITSKASAFSESFILSIDPKTIKPSS